MRILAPLLVLLCPGLALAHEFWISPDSYQIAPGAPITAELRIGQDFAGAPYSYLPNSFTRFDIVTGDKTNVVEGRIGDRPAVNQPAPEGLAVIVHETIESRVTYTDWSLFTSFAQHKDAAGAIALHQSRNLPKTGFSETYRRYAKSLVAVGHGQGADRAQGLEIEIIAQANPYSGTLAALPVQVLYKGKPRAQAQLEVFDKNPAGILTVSRLRLDDQGRANVPLTPGHEYLLDSVVLHPTDNDEPTQGAVWHSLWASFTFAVPLE